MIANTVPFRLDPVTLHRCFPNDDELRARIDELRAALARPTPHGPQGWPYLPAEFELRLELVMLHLSRGSDVRAVGESAVAELRAGMLLGRKKVDKAIKKRAKHLSRLAEALCRQWQGQYMLSTLHYLELDAASEEHDRDIQALTQLYAGTNDADQGLWDDAAEHFERSLLLAGCGEQLPDVLAAAVTGLTVARRHRSQDAA